MNSTDINRFITELKEYHLALQQVDGLAPSNRNELSEVNEVLQTSLEVLQAANEELTLTRQVVEQERQHYRNLFEFAPDGYLVTDKNGVIRDANVAATILLGKTHEKYLIGKPLVVFVAEDDRRSFYDQMNRLDSIERVEWTAQIRHSTGKPVAVAVTLMQVETPTTARTLRWMLRDVTRQQQIEADLQNQHQALQAMVAERTAQLMLTNQQLRQEVAERQQAEAALRQQHEREQLLNAISNRIRRSLDLNNILETAVREVRQVLHADRVIICQNQPNTDSRIVAEDVAPEWRSLLNDIVPASWLEEYLFTCHQRQTRPIADLQQSPFVPDEVAEYLEQRQVQAMITVPIWHGEEFLGVLSAHQCSAPRQWQASEAHLLDQLAAQVAIAMHQSTLYNQLQQLNTGLEQQVQNRTAQLQRALQFEALLQRITDKVRQSLDESQILQTVVQELTSVLGLEGCDASLYDLRKMTATIYYECAVSIHPAQGTVIHMMDFPEGYEQLLGGICFQFCERDRDADATLRGNFAKLACPIVDNQDALGDLWLFRPIDAVFDEAEVELVQQVASKCAIAIRQARLYQASQAQVEELQRLNYLKDDFLSTVSHELRTPVANMQMAIQMLQIHTNEEKRQRYLDILQSECRREANLINDILDLQRLEVNTYSQFVAERINLPDWLETMVAPLKSRLEDRQQTLHIDLSPELPPVTVDRASLERLLKELLYNASKYTPAEGAIELAVHQLTRSSVVPPSVVSHTDAKPLPLPDPHRLLVVQQITQPSQPILRFTIRNQAEIAVNELPRIFQKFYRIPKADPWKQSGTGLGLALVQKLVEQMRGNLQVESRQGWTTFLVELPLIALVHART